ncbi:hypothetical protein Emed_006166 [Eimeria media]
MTARVAIEGGPSGAPQAKRNSGSRKSRRELSPMGGLSDSDAACSSSSSSEEEAAATAPKPKRLQLDETLMQRVKKIQQQQQQQQQRGGLLLLGAEGGGAKQQQRKAQQVQQQQQLHSKLVALRVCMNASLRLSSCFPSAALLQQLQQQEQQQLQLQQQQQQQDVATAMCDVRKEAATLFVMLRRLQQLLLQQSSLAAAFTTAAADPDSAAAEAAVGGIWQQRREAYEAEQAAAAAAAAGAATAATAAAAGAATAAGAAGGGREGDVWRLVGDLLFSCGLKSACLANADAWHQQLCADDFYVELLKTAVAAGNDEVGPAEVAREKELLKSRRRADAAKEVDRRASKGRKIRYKPIPQLENFMVEGFLKNAEPSGFRERQAAEPWLPNTEALPGAGDSVVIESLMRNLFRGGG